MDGAAYLRHAGAHFQSIRRKADLALAQVDDAGFFQQIDGESNSLAMLVKHLSGNLRSRWTEFLTTDGEKPDRRRDAEFEREPTDTRAELLSRWAEGWTTLSTALERLAPSDLDRTVSIRGQPMTALEAIERQKEHYAYHTGQIVFLAKHLAGPAWKTLSIPRGGTDVFHARWAARPPGRPTGG